MQLLSKFHYEKIWQPTSDKDLEAIVKDEMPEAPLAETIAYIKERCDKGKTVRFINVAFKCAD